MLEFSKMHGAGNDFIVADDRNQQWPGNADFIQLICDRRRGIGADGLILLSAPSSCRQADIAMSFFNCDGKSAEMCGNGLRCAALFTHRHLRNQSHLNIQTESGILTAEIIGPETVKIEIPLKKSPEKITIDGFEGYTVNTGVPHLVLSFQDIKDIDIETEGARFRRHPLFQPEGTNVDFIAVPGQPAGRPIPIRTYERGVEGETAACGTGIAAAALTLAISHNLEPPIQFVTSHSEIMTVDFCRNDNMVVFFSNILLSGPAVEVFSGTINTGVFGN